MRVLILGMFVGALALSGPAVAGEGEASAERWSVGAGIGSPYVFGVGSTSTNLMFMPGSSGLGSYVSYSPSVAFTVAAERRIGRSTWLQVSVQGGYDSNEKNSEPQYSYPGGGATYSFQSTVRQEVRAGVFGGAVGPLYWLNPGSAVEVGLVGRLGASRATLDVDMTNRISLVNETGVTSSREVLTRRTGTGFAVGADVGLAVQRRFAEHLAVRLKSSLVEAVYSELTTRDSTEGLPDVPSFDGGLRLGLAFAPSLELRISF